MDHDAGSSKQSESALFRGNGNARSQPKEPSTRNASRPSSDIVFITADSTGSKEARQAIRRRAAQYSHKVGRKKPKTKKEKLEEREAERLALEKATSPVASPPVELLLREAGSETPGTGSSSSSAESTEKSLHTPPSDPDDDVELIVRDEHATVHLPKEFVTAMVLRRSLEDRDSIKSSSYPVPGKSWYPQLLDHLWTWMEQSWQHMPDTTPAERSSTLSFMQCLSMTEPAYFFMNLLSVADKLQDLNLIEPWKPIWLSGQVIKAINDALSDPVRMRSAGVILAVGRIALEEIVTGDRDAGEKYHRPAQARLIAMAGGLDAVGFPSMVYKHVCWADRVMTRVTSLSMVDVNPGVKVDTRPSFGPQPTPTDRDLELLNQYRPARRRSSRM